MIEPGSFAVDQPQRHRLRHEERRAHVEREDRVEILDLDVRQRSRPVHAGIVDENLKRLGRGDRPPRGLDVGDVEHQRVGLLAARADRRRRILDFAFGARGERHMRAGRRQRRRRRKPDAAPAAGDQRALAVEAEAREFWRDRSAWHTVFRHSVAPSEPREPAESIAPSARG